MVQANPGSPSCPTPGPTNGDSRRSRGGAPRQSDEWRRHLLRAVAVTAIIAAGTTTMIGQAGAISRVEVSDYDETVIVDAHQSGGAVTAGYLVAGTTYTLTVTGVYEYGRGSSEADAECSNLDPDDTYQPQRYAALEPSEDLLDLYVDGRNVEWQPTKTDELGCNSIDHTYQQWYTPVSTGPLRLHVHDPAHQLE